MMAHTPPQGFNRLPGSERSLPASAQQIKPAEAQAQIEVSVYLRDPSASSTAHDSAAHAQKPGQRMSRQEYMAQHSANPADLAAVKLFAQQYHLAILETDTAARKVILTGTVADLTAAFATELHHYEHAGKTFRGRTGYLHVPNALDQIIVGAFGLDDRPQAHSYVRFAADQAPTTSYTPPQVAQLYDFPANLTGSGQCIALIELGGGYRQADLTTYFEQLNLPKIHVVSISVDGGKNLPVGNANSADGEVALDIEVAGAIAPQAQIAVYFAPNTDRGFLDAINKAIHDTTHNPSVISISWGGPEANWTSQAMTAKDQAFQAAAKLGITD
ncbi:MAG: S53 family peptidase [Ktedonobacteraceae bacterium]